MFKFNKEFGDGILFTITNYVYWFFMGNLYFGLLNIPLIFILAAILSGGVNVNSTGFILIAFICAIPVGPAAAALLSVMGKLIREKSINITKDFFKAYKINFKQSLTVWTIENLLVSMLLIDIKFLVSQSAPFTLTMLLYAAIVLVIFAALYTLPIMTRFYAGIKDVVRLSAYYSFRKFNATFLNITIFAFAGILLFKVSMYFIFFITSIICYLLMFNLQKTLTEIENTLVKQVI